MDTQFPDITNWPDIVELVDQLDDVQRDANALVAGLSEEDGTWRPSPSAWSVAECLDHLALANREYLDAMSEPCEQARRWRRMRRGPAKPGFFGGLFIRSLEPPVKYITRQKAPRKIAPPAAPALAAALGAFARAHTDVRIYLRTNADLDLNTIRFPNPFIRGLAFSLATGLSVIAAHERRHLWQAWRPRRSAEAATRG